MHSWTLLKTNQNPTRIHTAARRGRVGLSIAMMRPMYHILFLVALDGMISMDNIPGSLIGFVCAPWRGSRRVPL